MIIKSSLLDDVAKLPDSPVQPADVIPSLKMSTKVGHDVADVIMKT